MSRSDRDALFASRLTPARVTQSSTSTDAEDLQRHYFAFLRPRFAVFFGAFFAAAFVFLFFAIAALLA